METINRIALFIFASSQDPRQMSLTIKGLLLGVIPFTMQAIGLVCAIGYTCYDVDQGMLEELVEGITHVAFYALSVVSAFTALRGLVRKLYRTAIGENRALK